MLFNHNFYQSCCTGTSRYEQLDLLIWHGHFVFLFTVLLTLTDPTDNFILFDYAANKSLAKSERKKRIYSVI